LVIENKIKGRGNSTKNFITKSNGGYQHIAHSYNNKGKRIRKITIATAGIAFIIVVTVKEKSSVTGEELQ